SAGVLNCRFIEGDACDIAGLVDCEVDLVFLANTFHGVPDKRRLAAQVARVLRAGGTFTILNWHRRPREETTVSGEPRGPATALRMAPEQTTAAVEPAGFRLVRVAELPPYHYGAVFRLLA